MSSPTRIRLSGTGTGERAWVVGVAANLDNLVVVDGEDLKDPLGGCRPHSFGLPRDADAHYDPVSGDLHALDGRPGTVGQEAPGPGEHLGAPPALAAPPHHGRQCPPPQPAATP